MHCHPHRGQLFDGEHRHHPRRSVLPMERQYQIRDESLKARLNKLLPALMKQCDIDFWIVICKEYNEDPVFTTMIPANQLYGSRLSALAFARKADGTVDALNVARPNGRFDPFYKNTFSPKDADEGAQWAHIANVIKAYDPKKIAINVAENCAMADGLTKHLYDKLAAAVGEEYVGRFVSAEALAIRWLETRTPEELLRYEAIYGLAVDIFEEGLSRRVIVPGKTHTSDVEWWLREEVHRLGLRESFANTVSIVRKGYPELRASDVIMPGDLVHCDFGLFYLGLATDMQRMIYVLRDGEETAPQGILDAYKACNRFQDICAENFVEGRTGNEVFRHAMEQARAEGLRPMLYTHPIGYRCHAPGTTIGLWDQQREVPGRGDIILYRNTCHALELNNTHYVPEWGHDVKIMQEETIAFVEDGKLHFYGPTRDVLRCI
ncbi:MAG: M24 family metallopeptidase [Clostridiales bacterium]|nr:M24 family metallopeptidase [Clostridiales bacterium]